MLFRSRLPMIQPRRMRNPQREGAVQVPPDSAALVPGRVAVVEVVAGIVRDRHSATAPTETGKFAFR